MAAWQYAGIAIPRTSYEQWDSLLRVGLSEIEPGDILVFSGAGHVGIYVGNGYMIDAPEAGHPVEKVSLAGYWDSQLIGAVRP
jgi:cell wall-associated NlpC family hydrolase